MSFWPKAERSYPGPEDEHVAHYWSLNPLRFTYVELFQLTQAFPIPNDRTGSTLRIILRQTLDDSMQERLSLEFEDVTILKLSTGGFIQLVELTIVSLADRGWESLRYIVDTPEDRRWEHVLYGVDTPADPTLQFYCSRFSAELIPSAHDDDSAE